MAVLTCGAVVEQADGHGMRDLSGFLRENDGRFANDSPGFCLRIMKTLWNSSMCPKKKQWASCDFSRKCNPENYEVICIGNSWVTNSSDNSLHHHISAILARVFITPSKT